MKRSPVNTDLLKPRFVTESDGNTYWQAYNQFDVTATTDYDKYLSIESNGVFDVKFVQHLREQEPTLPGGFNAYIDQNEGYIQFLNIDGVGPNYTYWFNDSDADNAPYYPTDKDMFVGPMPNRMHVYEFDDSPGARVKNGDDWLVSDVGFIDEFRLEVVWSNQHTINCQDIIYPIGYVDWKVEFDMKNHAEGDNNDIYIECSFTYSNSPQYPYVPMYASDAIRSIKVPR